MFCSPPSSQESAPEDGSDRFYDCGEVISVYEQMFDYATLGKVFLYQTHLDLILR